MIRKWMIGGVGVVAAAVFLMGTSDSAWARRCCKVHKNRCCAQNGNYGMTRNTSFTGTGCCGANSTSFYNNSLGNNWVNGTSSPMNVGPTVTNQSTSPSQPYTSGYAPQTTFDSNGNPLNNQNNQTNQSNNTNNSNAPIPATDGTNDGTPAANADNVKAPAPAPKK